jgi:succinate-semialdehyde dehydrogenase/glutarate-semialdehyde dehydrogenase
MNADRLLSRQPPFLIEAITAVALIAAPFVLPYFDAAPNTVNRILVWGLFGIGFDILFGYTGLLSFGQSALYGTGGFVAAYLLTRAGFPRDLFRTLMIGSADVEAVIAHPRVAAVTLTGSGPAGRAVAAKAGTLLKKTVLELGGSDPYLVLEDADLVLAADVCTKARLVNSGQSCIAGKRFIVVDAVRGEFERRFVARMAAAKMGDPQDETTQIGPQARRDLRDTLQRQVDESVAKGARVLLGGTIPDGPGAFYPPSVLTGVRPGMPAFDEELFGPVAAVISARHEADAIALANASRFGLGGGVITRDVARGERIAADLIESGSVFVNDAVRSDVRLPFGGVKESGYGRELAAYGIREFVNVKTVYVA